MCHVGGVLGYGAHAGKKDEVHAAWRASMAELATCPNVSVKLGGMRTGYATLWNAFKRITAGCSQIEKLALYSGTAKRLYHLD